MRASSSAKIITVSGSYSLKKPKSPRDRSNSFLLSIPAVIVYEKNRWAGVQWAETEKGGGGGCNIQHTSVSAGVFLITDTGRLGLFIPT